MISRQTVKDALHVDVAISQPMALALQKWSLMYVNQAEWLDKDVKSLNLPAAIASEIARAVTLELKVVVAGSPRADFLSEQLQMVVSKLRQQMEYGAAKGGLMMKPYVSGKTLLVDFVQADCFYPISFDASGNITAVVFSDQRQVGGKFYTRLEYHNMVAGGCEIKNQAYKSDSVNVLGTECALTDVDVWKNLVPEATVQKVDKPLYAYFRFPAANNIDSTSPLGVSCYARAVDLIQQADEQWSNLLWEFESGKRAMYVDELAFGKDTNGKPLLPIKRLYRTIGSDAPVDQTKLFEEWSPDLREQNILAGLEAILRKVEFNCGLSYGTLSNPATIDKTATELKISQQRYYALVTDIQKVLKTCLEQLLSVMDVWATLSKLAPKGSFEATYDFDDSVVTDTEAQMAQDRQTVTMAAMPKVEFLKRNYGLSEEDAKKWLADSQTEQVGEQDLFGEPTAPGTKKPVAVK